MSVPQNKFQKILYQAQQIIISHIDTSAFQAVQQNEGCMWRPEKKITTPPKHYTCFLIPVKRGEKPVYL